MLTEPPENSPEENASEDNTENTAPPASEETSSSLPQEILDELRTAQTDASSPLLDDTPVDGRDILGDEEPLVPPLPEEMVEKASPLYPEAELSEELTEPVVPPASQEEPAETDAKDLLGAEDLDSLAAALLADGDDDNETGEESSEAFFETVEPDFEPAPPLSSPEKNAEEQAEQRQPPPTLNESSEEFTAPLLPEDLEKIINEQLSKADAEFEAETAVQPDGVEERVNEQLQKALQEPFEAIPDEEPREIFDEIGTNAVEETVPPSPPPDADAVQNELNKTDAQPSDITKEHTKASEAQLPEDQLDALIAQQTEPSQQEQPAEQVEPEQEQELSQDDLNALIAQQTETAQEQPPKAEEPEQDLSQDDLDALIAQQTETTPKQPPKAEEPEQDLSQDDLDALIAQQTGAAQEEAPKAEEPEQDLSQDDLDALIAQQTDAAQEEPEQEEPEQEAELSQNDLDALIAQQTGEAQEEAPKAEEPEQDLSQDDLDALIAQQTGAAQEEPEKEEELSQNDLDALIAQQTGAAAPKAEEPEQDLSQDDLDALIAQQTETPQEEPEQEEELSQDDLDALIAQQTGAAQEEAPKQEEPEQDLSQDDLDALIAQQTGAAQEEPEKEEELSQNDLDALIAQQTGAAQEEAPKAEEPEQDLSQDDLDALIAQQTDAAQEEAPKAEEPEQDLSQDDLDALIAQQTGAAQEEPEKEEELSQNDLDALIAQQTGAAQEEPEKEEELSQNDLDALIAQQTGAAQEEAPKAEEPEQDLSQDNLDALIAQQAEAAQAESPKEEQESPPPADDALLDQSALDALLSEMQSDDAEEPVGATDDSAPLTQDSIDALLTEAHDEQPLTDNDQDALLVNSDAKEEVPLDQSSIDNLMAEISGEAEEKESSTQGAEVSQDMIDALVASAAEGQDISSVAAENLTAAATTPEEPAADLLSQDDLDAVIEQAKIREKEKKAEKQRALEAALATAGKKKEPPAEEKKAEKKPKKPKEPKEPTVVSLFIRNHYPRLVLSTAAGLLVTLATFTTLYYNQEHVPDLQSIIAQQEDTLEIAIRRARTQIERGNYSTAAKELAKAIARAEVSPRRDDAAYLRLEALCRAFSYVPNSPEYNDLHNEIDAVVKTAPNHPDAPEALYWKAKLYELDGVPYAAQHVYDEIMNQYTESPHFDEILMDAAKLSMELRDPLRAAEATQRLVRQYPGSPLVGEARLIRGDAYAMAGMEDDARTLFVRVAQAEPYSQLGAEALLRLGRLAFQQGRYKEAIHQLESRLETATSLQDNDEVYLMLAQAYRHAGNLERAEERLTELLQFFPESAVSPKAWIELSQVYEDMGRREDALRIAQEAAVRYAQNPNVLKNNGELLGLAGNTYAAANALVSADAAGAKDPQILLTAGRLFRALGMGERAKETFGQLRKKYAGTEQALRGSVEEAEMAYQLGELNAAVAQLKELLVATEGSVHRQPALIALANIYQDLGLHERTAELAQEIVATATEPEVLANAATALFYNGALDEAKEIAKRVDLAAVKNNTAYTLLSAQGNALLNVDPKQGLKLLEEAYLRYPDVRTPEGNHQLLEAYLAAERPAAARRMVMEMESRVREKPVETPYLIDAAITWGDYLYDKSDFRAAADAYSIAIDSAMGAERLSGQTKKDPSWAKYQRANALLELADFKGSLALYEQIAETSAPWAQEAGVKAEYARLEQRLRGINTSENRKG